MTSSWFLFFIYHNDARSSKHQICISLFLIGEVRMLEMSARVTELLKLQYLRTVNCVVLRVYFSVFMLGRYSDPVTGPVWPRGRVEV